MRPFGEVTAWRELNGCSSRANGPLGSCCQARTPPLGSASVLTPDWHWLRLRRVARARNLSERIYWFQGT